VSFQVFEVSLPIAACLLLFGIMLFWANAPFGPIKKISHKNCTKQLVKEKLITLSSLVSLFCVAKKRIKESTQKEISLNKGVS